MDKETLLIALKEKGATESALMEIGCSYRQFYCL